MEFGTVIFLAAALVILIIWGYNNGVSLKNYVNEAFSTMDVYLKKRWDLIPNLIECTKNYADYEKNVLLEITNLRTKEYDILSQEKKLKVNEQLNAALFQIFAIAENYPELKANETYLNLMNELSQVEDDIANARKYYNGTVRELNNFLEMFPTNLIGMMFKIKKEKMFEIELEQRENIKLGQ